MSELSIAPVLLVAMPQLQDPNFHRTVVLLVEHSSDGALGLVLNRESDLKLSDLCRSLDIEWEGNPRAATAWGGPVEPNKGWMLFSAPVPDATDPVEAREHRNGDTNGDIQDAGHHENGHRSNGDDASEQIQNGSGADDGVNARPDTHDEAPESETQELEAHEAEEGDAFYEDDDEDLDDESDARELFEGVYFGVTLDTLRSVAQSSSTQFRLFLGYAGWGAGQLEREMAQGDWIVAPAHAECVFGYDNEDLWARVIGSLGVDPTHLISTPGIH